MSYVPPSDAELRELFGSVKTIAVVGASSKPDRPSNEVFHFLQGQGYDVYPVNPAEAGKEIHGTKVYATLKELPVVPDMVDVFRNSADALVVTEEAIAVGSKKVWLQLGVQNEQAAAKAKENGVFFVQNRCPKIDIPRLGLLKARH
ncbi:CoA-binding domain-containing protein [Hyaloraphidium curvatum]|nr:CoA-binding domain-containing protein [Hyaloraphidium curvatum]